MNPTYGPPITQDEARLIEAMLQNLPPNITLGLSNYTPPRARDQYSTEQLMDELTVLEEKNKLLRSAIKAWEDWHAQVVGRYELPPAPIVIEI